MRNKPFFLFEKEGKELHFYHFTPITIAKMLKKAGFNVFLLKPDISGTTFLRRIIDKATNSILFPFRINISLCMQVYARKMN